MPAVAYRIIFADGTEEPGEIDLPPNDESGTVNKPSENKRKRWAMVREVAQRVVGEDNDVEHVTVWHGEQYLDMFVDETGANKDLPINAKATAIYRANWLAHEPNPGPAADLPHIAGDAVLFLEKVWG